MPNRDGVWCCFEFCIQKEFILVPGTEILYENLYMQNNINLLLVGWTSVFEITSCRNASRTLMFDLGIAIFFNDFVLFYFIFSLYFSEFIPCRCIVWHLYIPIFNSTKDYE
jgi:hypothetical protein